MDRFRASLVVAAVALCAAGPAAALAAPPDDPYFDQQWALARDSALGVQRAWEQSRGQGVTVAVLDTGVDFGHADLEGAFWTNPGEVAGNGRDDDGNGFVDDVHGADVVNSDGDPRDDEGHGTHVAGIIAARGGNARGGVGIAPAARLMVVKVLDGGRSGRASDLAAGIRYAVANGARIINTSVNGDGQSRSLQEAIREANAAGALIVASSGNDGRNIDLTPSYPASYPDPAVIVVAAAEQDGRLAGFSNFGPGAVDLAAPGRDVLSTAMSGGYELRSGTSMAAPFASGTLALMKAARPDLDAAALRRSLLGAVRPVSLLQGVLGGGALDTAGALRSIIPPGGWQGSSLPFQVHTLPARRAKSGTVLRWTTAGAAAAVARLEILLDGRSVADRFEPAAGRLRVHPRPGRHHWRVVARDAAGEQLAVADGTFTTPRKRR